MKLVQEVLYRTQVTATGRRDMRAVSSDGALDLKLTTPHELGGVNGRGTNPEQLFAAGYASSFLAALRRVAARVGISLPPETSVDAIVGVGVISNGFALELEIRVSLPGVARTEADALVEKAIAVCSYSNATRGNLAMRIVAA